LIQSRALTWDLTLTGSVNRNRLVQLAPGISTQLLSLNIAQMRQTPGFPLYGVWAQKVTYADKNRDGIIETNEITIADSNTYVGSSQPTQEASASTHVALWHGTLALNALFDYRGGFRVVNYSGYIADYLQARREGNDPTAPLVDQARYAAAQSFNGALFVEDGTFVRFRELGLTYTVPASLTHRLHVGAVSLTGSVRNLMLWTRYGGIDPEASYSGGFNSHATSPSGRTVINNDVRLDYGAVGLARYFILRLTAGL
jgi:hypothetical protein